MIARLKTLAGLDFHVFLTLLLRGWGILAGGATTLLLPFWLTPGQQGFYYTFGSLLALQVFFELGLNQVIIQLVSHEAAHLQLHDDGTITGDAERIHRLSAIRRLVQRWYLIAAALFAVITGLAGHVFFERRGGLPTEDWLPVWACLVAFTAVNLYMSPRLAIVEGTGHIGQVARLRLIQSVLGYGTLWALLLAGAGLWVAAVVPAVSALTTWVWIRIRADGLRHAPSTASGPGFSWRRDIFPLQWRLAVSWASGYFIFNLFTPIIFAHHGAKEAGRFGMAMAIFNAVTTVGLSWINAKAPTLTMHISRGESTDLNRVFRGVLIRSVAFTGILSTAVVATAAVATQIGWSAIGRIADLKSLLAIAVATTINVLVYACASYMRAHREEPMVPVSVVSAGCTIAAVVLTATMPVAWMMALYAAIGGLVTLPWTVALLRGYQARHATLSAKHLAA
ncbi:hypothetical protein ACQ859_07480 [Roseateles chitinivorans]|uniref:hypothetical protein n=1 Tax=Roseateles chitinivorans TaxID=2917965 RepID=UPI003D678A42